MGFSEPKLSKPVDSGGTLSPTADLLRRFRYAFPSSPGRTTGFHGRARLNHEIGPCGIITGRSLIAS